MTTYELSRKAELYYRLNGFYNPGQINKECRECTSKFGHGKRCNAATRRYIFVEWDKDNHWVVKGYGVDFGMSYENQFFQRYCIEFLDERE